MLAFVVLGSCRKDFDTTANPGVLEFSRDTVYLDTIFTNIGSSTYNLKVYNRTDSDININSIRLKETSNSKFRLNVDGIAGNSFNDLNLAAKDSLYVFVETTVDINEVAAAANQFLVTDAIQFNAGIQEQQVVLVSLVKDAIFLFPERFNDGSTETLILGEGTANESEIYGFYLDDSELAFTKEKPYVIYGYAAVPSGKTLSINPGTRVHFHKDSGLIIANQASLKINGELSSDQKALENEVVFEGDRLETRYANVPGQWGAIWLTAGSTDNQINYTTVKNGTIGVLADSNNQDGLPTLSIKNSQLINNSNFGLLARTAIIEAENSIFGGAGLSSVYLNIGGRYTFKHCTLANYYQSSARSFPTLLIDNYTELEDSSIFTADLNQATFANCIITGDNNLEVFLEKNENAAFNFQFVNCLLKFNNTGNQFANNPLYDFENTLIYENLLLNADADFLNPSANQFLIGLNSAGIDQANPTTASQVPLDILGIDRRNNPDLGAYQASDISINN
jgi:hypothetical protein